MKIFFAGSIRGGRNDASLYSEIINLLSGYGKVLTEHIGHQHLSVLGEEGATNKLRERDIRWLSEADIAVAEVTTPSLGVGYEIAKAEELDKKILCLYREIKGRSISAMISGSEKLTFKKYKTIKEVKDIFEKFCRESGIKIK